LKPLEEKKAGLFDSFESIECSDISNKFQTRKFLEVADFGISKWTIEDVKMFIQKREMVLEVNNFEKTVCPLLEENEIDGFVLFKICSNYFNEELEDLLENQSNY
jgi:hypothetical protein